MQAAYSRLPSGRIRKLLVIIALLVPPVLVYALLWRSFSQLPFLDDYPLLEFAIELHERAGVLAKWLFVLSAQHNEYKLWFPHALVAMQIFLHGHVNFSQLAGLADAVLILVGCAVWLIARRDERAQQLGLIWFVPVVWILFELQYASALNWGEGGLQGLSVIAFALLAFVFCDHSSLAAFGCALGCMALAVGSNANGLLIVPIGAWQLWMSNSKKHAMVWLTFGAAVAALYLFRYKAVHHVQNGTSHTSITYAAAFLGAVCTSQILLPAVIGGAIFLLGFACATRDSLYKSAAAMFSSMAFCVLTALGLSASRAEEYGLTQALASRYRLYSVLMLCLLYLYLAPQIAKAVRSLRRPYLVLLPTSVLLLGLTLMSDRAGFHLLLNRRAALQSAMARYTEGLPPEASTEKDDASSDIVRSRLRLGLYEPNRTVLASALAIGVYQLPQPATADAALRGSLTKGSRP